MKDKKYPMEWVGKNPLNRKVLKASDTITSGIKEGLKSNNSRSEEGNVIIFIMKRKEYISKKILLELYSDLILKKGMLKGELGNDYKIEFLPTFSESLREDGITKEIRIDIKNFRGLSIESFLFKKGDVMIKLTDLSIKRSIVKVDNKLYLNTERIKNKKEKKDILKKQITQILSKYVFLGLLTPINTTR